MRVHPVGRELISGGTTGPEGSIFLLVILGVASVVAIRMLPRTSTQPSLKNAEKGVLKRVPTDLFTEYSRTRITRSGFT